MSTLEEHFNWDNQIDSCTSLTELTDFEKSQAKNAFLFLRKELGENFPESVMVKDTRFRDYFWNKVPWTRMWFVWLAESIKHLQTAKNYNTVLKKIKSNNRDDFDEAELLLEFGFKFSKAGFNVDFEIEAINASGNIKNPDIFLTNPETKEHLYIEVTRLKSNPELNELSEIFHNISLVGFQQGKQINSSGRLFKVLSKAHLNEIKLAVKSKVNKVLENDSFEVVIEEGVIELAIASENNLNLLQQWSDEHSYNVDSFILPDIDRFRRLKGKITRKSIQSSNKYLSLLIIKDDDFTFLTNPANSFYSLEETLYKCNDLFGAVIINYHFGNTDKKVESFGMNTFITRTERHAITSLTGIMLNKFYKKVPVTMHTLTRIIEAFEKY